MLYRKLGSSNLRVSVLSFGAWQIGDTSFWGDDAHADAQATVDAAIDAGINFFDTAEMYGQGESERVLGRCLGPKRSRVIIASKAWPDKCSPKILKATCEASLNRLGIDAIDLYQIHWPARDVPFEDTYGALVELRQEGKIREIGVSNFGADDLDRFMAIGSAVSNQLAYNLLFRAIEYDIVPACIRHNAGILTYMPLMQGLLAGRWENADDMPVMRCRSRHFSCTREGTRHGEPGAEELTFQTVRDIRRIADTIGQPMANVALAWNMAQPGITSVIVGARHVDQLTRNLAALDLALSPDISAELNRVTLPLKEHFGRNADMWLPDDQRRVR